LLELGKSRIGRLASSVAGSGQTGRIIIRRPRFAGDIGSRPQRESSRFHNILEMIDFDKFATSDFRYENQKYAELI
jgi:hypothetical protein